MKRLAVVAPGFSADCLETLEELDMENRAVFLANGGEKFTCVPCLNDSEPGLRVIEHRRAARADGLVHREACSTGFPSRRVKDTPPA